MAKYAKDTYVPVSKSKQQVQDVLKSFGVEEMFWGTSPRGDGIGFKYQGKVYKHNVTNPDRSKFKTEKQYEQALRQRWRIFYMSLKMKLEEISEGGMSFEDQFLSMLALPDGSTMSNFIKLPETIEKLKQSKMPLLLP